VKIKYDAGEVVIVDVRSKIEYNVIHPKDAVHVSVANIPRRQFFLVKF